MHKCFNVWSHYRGTQRNIKILEQWREVLDVQFYKIITKTIISLRTKKVKEMMGIGKSPNRGNLGRAFIKKSADKDSLSNITSKLSPSDLYNRE